jgi:hypothetical protein
MKTAIVPLSDLFYAPVHTWLSYGQYYNKSHLLCYFAVAFVLKFR